jgi:hypothetical protein
MVAAVNKDTMTLTKAAMTAFVAYWEQNATNAELMEVESGGRPEFRNAQTATEMVFNYIEERKHTLCRSDFELLDIERPFAVPLDPENPSLIYIGRWDKIFRYQGRIYIGEHKTTSLYKREGPFQNSFVESFSPNSQIDGYLYAGMMEYGRDLKAVWVDAALVHRDVHDGFRFIPVERQFAQIETWLWETTYWINQIEANKSVYGSLANIPASERAKLEYLPAFPKNTVSCTQYGGCPYLDLCKMWSNPDRHPAPLGFVEEKWEPFDELKIAAATSRSLGRQTVQMLLLATTRFMTTLARRSLGPALASSIIVTSGIGVRARIGGRCCLGARGTQRWMLSGKFYVTEEIVQWWPWGKRIPDGARCTGLVQSTDSHTYWSRLIVWEPHPPTKWP